MTTCVLFEEDGGFKVAHLFSEADTTVQVEMPTGKRVKIKRAAVLLTFTQPARDLLLPAATQIAEQLDAQFLWEVAPEEEFEFQGFAKEVFSDQPSVQERAGLLLALHQAPMYFYRKGKGRYRRAPEEALKSALAGAERKRLAAQAQAALHDALVAGELPDEIRANAVELVIKPDKQSIAFKALESAAHALQVQPARLLLARQALPSVYVVHRARFMQQCFPQGAGFVVSDAEVAAAVAFADKQTLPIADVAAYSIDDASTTEIDDAFSCVPRPEGGWRVGIHIAAPGLGITPESPLGQIARERASTVYFPGDKITMLPAAAIGAFSLDEGRTPPALSLYVEFNADGERVASQTRVERVPIARNLRLGDWESELDQPLSSIAEERLPWAGLKPLMQLALKLREQREIVRGKPEVSGRTDFNFYVDWNGHNPQAMREGDGVPRIVTRRRGSPVDILVSEFMILTNTTWGDRLALARLPGVYRVQTMGRVRMQTQGGPHQGLGVSNYCWATSPLRRYSDLLNQWQLLSVLGLRSPVFKGNEAELFSSVTQFDALYNQYADFQDHLERYWSLRWLGVQHGLGAIESWSAVGKRGRERAVALREGAFRLRRAPVVFRCADAPELTPGVEVEVELVACDALDARLEARFVSVTSATPEMDEEELGMLSERYAVLGDPIAHSKSPWIHGQFAALTGQTMAYEAIRVPADQLAAELDRLMGDGFGGVNLTVPLKEHAFALAQSRDWEISQRALTAGAVNTLRFDGEDNVVADNTDGLGLVRDLERLLGAPGALSDKTVLLIGAGGAAQGVLGPLRSAGVRHIRLANRNFEKAQQVADRWGEMDAGSQAWLAVMPLSVLASPPVAASDPEIAVDIIINASSASLSGARIDLHAQWCAHTVLAYDMMYGPADTSFMQQARAAGVPRVADGLGMLVEQAAEAFALWRGVRPDTASVLAQLRLQLAAAPH